MKVGPEVCPVPSHRPVQAAGAVGKQKEKREGSTLPALRSSLVRVGEPRPAARCKGVFPAKVRLVTSAPSYGERCKAMRMGFLGTAPPTPSP